MSGRRAAHPWHSRVITSLTIMDIPRTLRDRLRADKVIPFVGAGVSMSVLDRKTDERLFPSWRELLERAANRLEEEKKIPYATIVRSLLDLDKPDYLEAARRAREGLGEAIWYEFLGGQFDYPRERVKAESLKLAQAIWNLKSQLVITANYDDVLRWALPPNVHPEIWDIEAPAEMAALLRGEAKRPTIWHLHGHIHNKSEIILTRDGYNRLYPEAEENKSRDSYQAALHTLHTRMASHTFLFIGFSLDDAYFGMQMEGIRTIYHGATGPHYVLARKDDIARGLPFSDAAQPIPFEDFGEPLLELVHELGAIARNRGTLQISQLPSTVNYNQPTYRKLRVFLCHSSDDKPAVRDLYKRLYADGVEPWLDEEDLLPGQEWEQEIPEAVRNSDIVIVCLSRGSLTKKGYIQKEIKYALDISDEQPSNTIYLIPLKLEECEIPERLRRWQGVNLFEDKGYERLMRALKRRAEKL